MNDPFLSVTGLLLVTLLLLIFLGDVPLALVSLNPGSSCVVTVQFRPLTTDPIHSVRQVTDSAGTQTSILNGTAN